MIRGRKPTPTHLKLVNRNPGKRKLAHQELSKQRRIRPTCTLTKHQKKIWARCIKYAPYGLLQHIDAELLTNYAIAKSIYDEAAQNISSGPLMIRSNNGFPIQSPWLGILSRQLTMMLSLASELGFTPTSRARLGVRDDHELSDEIAAKYFDD